MADAATTANYVSPRTACFDERNRMLKAMNEALAKPTPDDRLKGVVAAFSDPQYNLYQKKIALGQELKLWETISKSPVQMGHEGYLYLDWQAVYETPTEAALRITARADNRKSIDCSGIARDKY